MLLVLFLLVLGNGCGEPPRRSDLPPSASDLILLKTAQLCHLKTAFLQAHPGFQRHPWGTGEELRQGADGASQESYFFDEDGLLVGALFAYPSGLNLKPYPVLRRTLEELPTTLEFYLDTSAMPERANLEPTSLYQTGDEKSTTQYLVLGAENVPTMLLASFAIDPYAKLLSPYRKEFLIRIEPPERRDKAQPKGSDQKEPFLAMQQFARGETAHFGSCGSRDDRRAVDAYTKAIAQGFSDKVWLAEAHHRLGLALERIGRLDQAKAALQQSLGFRPNSPDVLNSLGVVHAALGERDKAIEAFERAVVLRPNYPMARFNLAKAYEAVNAKRAISEYETYLALVEGIPEEETRAALAMERVKALK
jgi:tetratricopeptide (TPR) repeat protein